MKKHLDGFCRDTTQIVQREGPDFLSANCEDEDENENEEDV